MNKKTVKNENKLDELENKTLSMEEVLAEIGNALTKEKTRRENANKSQNTGVFQLTANMMVQPGESDFAAPMSKDLSTLKSIIQMIVRDEIRKVTQRLADK